MLDYLFLFLEAVLYIAFIIKDFIGSNSILIKYCGIICCFIYIFYLTFKKPSRNNVLRLIACLLTLVADYFLLVTNQRYDIGIILFCLVQTIYASIIDRKDSNILRYSLFGLLILIISYLDLLEFNTAFALYSIVNLFYNVIYSVKYGNVLFFIGLLLFLCCDICVGLYNLTTMVQVTSNIQAVCKIAGDLMWVFYLPSQVLIMYSGDHYEK